MASSCSGCDCARVVIWMIGWTALKWQHDCCHAVLPCCVAMCIERLGLATCCCKMQCKGCMDVAGASFLEIAGARNLLCFSRVKWLRPTMKGTLCVCGGCGCGRFDVFFPALKRWLQAVLDAIVCVRNFRGIRKLGWQIAVERLHECCHAVLPCCVAMCMERCRFAT